MAEDVFNTVRLCIHGNACLLMFFTALRKVSTSVNSSAATQSDVFTDPTPGRLRFGALAKLISRILSSVAEKSL